MDKLYALTWAFCSISQGNMAFTHGILVVHAHGKDAGCHERPRNGERGELEEEQHQTKMRTPGQRLEVIHISSK
jgi:hypothetical protein